MIKKKKQMMFTSLCMLLVATLALSTTSYAWFTQTNTAKLDNVEFTAQAAQGIEISFDAETWKSTLGLTEFVAQSANNGDLGTDETATMSSVEFIPRSTDATGTNVASGKLVLYSGDVTDNGTKLTTAATTTGFYVYNMYFRNAGASTNTLVLKTASSSVVATDTTNKPKHMEYSVRVAFIDQGSTALGSGDVTNARALRNGTAASCTIWEPNAASHSSFASATAVAKSYQGISAAGSIPYANGAVTASATTVNTVTTADGNIAVLAPNTITKVTVYVWIEGQDIDCINGESGGSVNLGLQFISDPATT